MDLVASIELLMAAHQQTFQHFNCSQEIIDVFVMSAWLNKHVMIEFTIQRHSLIFYYVKKLVIGWLSLTSHDLSLFWNRI